jgi:hypothetical protein
MKSIKNLLFLFVCILCKYTTMQAQTTYVITVIDGNLYLLSGVHGTNFYSDGSIEFVDGMVTSTPGQGALEDIAAAGEPTTNGLDYKVPCSSGLVVLPVDGGNTVFNVAGAKCGPAQITTNAYGQIITCFNQNSYLCGANLGGGVWWFFSDCI